MNFTDDLVSKMTSALEDGFGSDQELADVKWRWHRGCCS
jgi:hypothetical protein